MAEGQELAKTHEPLTPHDLEAAYGAILDGKPVAQFDTDPEIVSRRILERILAADSFEEAFRPQELDGWQVYVNRPVRVIDFHLNPSTKKSENGKVTASVYAVVDLLLIDPNGEAGDEVTVSCGGRNVLAQLVTMRQNGWMDRTVKLTAKQTGEGNTALWLEAA